MIKIDKSVNNQAIGLLPLLLFMFLDNYFSYLLSFIIGITLCFVTMFLYQILRRDRVYQLMLLPVALTLVIYSVFMCFQWDALLFIHSEILVELIFVTILISTDFFRTKIYQRLRNSELAPYKRMIMKSILNEYFFVLRLVKNLFTLHLFVVLFLKIMPESMKDISMINFIDRQAAIYIGIGIMLYEAIRLRLVKGKLNHETWLPVLSDNGKVIGCIARSVSGVVPKKYFHPVVRIAVVYEGMLYLVNRNNQTYVSPEATDYPFYSYVLFRHSIESTVKRLTQTFKQEKESVPRFQLRYVFENDKVKHLVNLFVMRVKSESEFKKIKGQNGKLWTVNQIKENLGSGIFSEYFEQEFEYLQQTVLFAENTKLWADSIN